MSPRRPHELPAPVRKGLGSPVLFGLVQAFIAAALYFSLGHVADRAHGWTWLVYLAAAGFFLLTVLTYVEAASMHKERGGATVFARYAFNELWSFVAGWAILLDYVILIALTALVATDYLGVFVGSLESGLPELLLALALLFIVTAVNVRGLDPARFERIALAGLADLAVQIVVVVVGLALLFEPDVLSSPSSIGGDVGFADLAFGFTLAIVACTGLDASSGFAGQVAIGRRGLKRLVVVRMIAVLVPYLGLTVVASGTSVAGTLPPELRDSALLGVFAGVEQDWLREALRYTVGMSAALVLGAACMAAMLGLSRLGYSLALNRQVPSAVGRLHPRHATPVVVIGVATVLAIGLMVPTDVELLAGAYAFGATIAFTLAHLAVIRMRFREPSIDRPFVIPFNVRVGRVQVPVPAVLGALISAASFVGVVVLHESAGIVGAVWMTAGLVLYVTYRVTEGKSLFSRVTVTESVLKREAIPGVEYGTILVPVLGTPLDDDIMQTAGRLAAERPEDDLREDGAQIEAMWVFEVPMSSPLDGPLPSSDLKEGRAALAHAKAVGEEYEGVQVNTFTVRARSAGQAIVHEARRRGVEAIVMPAEEPTRIRGGVLYGGKRGLRDTFVGETTRYVVNKASCRVILTAPPAIGSGHVRPRRGSRPSGVGGGNGSPAGG